MRDGEVSHLRRKKTLLLRYGRHGALCLEALVVCTRERKAENHRMFGLVVNE